MSERDGYQHGVPCWVDTWQPDADRAAAFYAGIFGWEAASDPDGPPYVMLRLRGRDVAAVGRPQGDDAPPPDWTTYVWVDSADEAASKARAAGGSVVREPFDSLDGGRMAILADPSGAVFGVWQPGAHRGAELVNEPGAYAMSMLHTNDPEAAEAFYGEVFGWTMEPFGPATMWRLPGYVGGEPEQPVSREVIAVMMPSDQEPHWGVNFWVADADAAASEVPSLGGTVVAGPYDTPGFREAAIADPAGVAFTMSSRKLPPG
jgi:predicted enzyme related to lactoylglutathione lyase